MNKNTKRVLSAITIASLAVVPDGVAPTVAPSVFNLNGGVIHAAEENIVDLHYRFEGKDDLINVKVNIAENPNATVGDYYPLSKDGADLKYITKGKGMMWVYKVDPDHNYRVDHRGDLLSKYAHLHLLGVYTKPKNADANAGTNNNAGTEVKPNNDGNANAGANNNEKAHKVTINYDLYDDPMLPFSSSSSKVFDVTPNQPLSDHIPETLPGGYVFYGASAHSGVGSEIAYLRSRNDLFGNWTNINITYTLRLKKSRTNLSNASTINNEKPHKVTIYYYPYDGYPGEPTKKVVDVTPNQPLSDHFPETLAGGYVFAGAIANGGGSEGGVSLSSRNDLFGNETTFYARYLPKSKISRTNPSNAGTNNNAGTEVKPNNDGNTNAGTNNNAGTEVKPNNDSNTNAGTNNNASTEVKPNNGNTNAGTNNNTGTEVKPNNGNSNSGNDNSNAEENIVHLAYHFEGKDGLTGVKVNIAENPNATVGDYYPLSKDGGDLKYLTDGKARMWVYNKKSVGVDFRGDLLSKHAHLLGEYTQPNNAGTEVKPNNGNTNVGTNNNADTEVKPGNNDNTGNNKPENKPAPENKPNNNSNAENTNTNNNVTPSEDIINNIFSNDASGVKVTLTDKTTAVKLSATPVEDKALASSVLEKLNLPADNQTRILDLKLLDKDNHVVNSNAKRTVAIVLKEDEKDVAIYHIKDNGELKLIDSTTKDGVVTFEIDHFSKFAIVSNKSKQTSNINNSKSGKYLAKTGLSNNNLASLAAIGLVLSGALIFGRRKNRK